MESKYPHRERRDYTASAPYRREANRFPPGNDANCRITREIDWSARRPPADINFTGVQDMMEKYHDTSFYLVSVIRTVPLFLVTSRYYISPLSHSGSFISVSRALIHVPNT